ncbi:Eco57I restriction-modification methylase domain-containing protein [Lactonifactor longoviformis]|uniref:Eco57I restriction-modification methylase domain-containing protein n=1 Tax=Lactonifactor longoviformis TaxID=341220 RepID=UPI0034E3D7BE
MSCALIKVLQREKVKRVNLTCYEIDNNILTILQNNLDYIKKNTDIEFEYEIKTDNYITSQYLDFNQMIGGNSKPKKYDIVIGNPPYMNIPKDAPEATAMPEVCYGTPNLYFLFASMGLFNLKPEGQMVNIIPRSWTSGAYFEKFREYFLTKGKLKPPIVLWFRA